jgi:hypothetical protein
LPIDASTALSPSTLAREVVGAALNSTSGIRCAGFSQCALRNRSGFGSIAASFATGNVDVEDAITASGRAARASQSKQARFASSSSGTPSK